LSQASDFETTTHHHLSQTKQKLEYGEEITQAMIRVNELAFHNPKPARDHDPNSETTKCKNV